MRTQNKPFVVEIKKAKRAIDAPAESPAPRGAAASPSIWNSMPEPSQPPLTASAARRAADALFDFKPKTAQPAPPVERETPVVDATPIAAALPASPSTPSPTGRVLWVERPNQQSRPWTRVLMSFRPVGVADGHARTRHPPKPKHRPRSARVWQSPVRGLSDALAVSSRLSWSSRFPSPPRRRCRRFSRRRLLSRPFPCSAPYAASGPRSCRVANAGRTAFPSSAAETSLRRKAEPTWDCIEKPCRRVEGF